MAAQVRFVNTDSTTGGDGTTNATTGAQRAHNDWKDLHDNYTGNKDLIAAGDTLVVNFSAPSGVADTRQIDWNAPWLCDATNFITFQGEPSTTGGYDVTKYRLERTATSSNQWGIRPGGPDTIAFALFNDLQFKFINSGGFTNIHCMEGGSTSGDGHLLDRCILVGEISGAGSQANGWKPNGNNMFVRNSIAIDFENLDDAVASATCFGFNLGAQDTTSVVTNSTAIDCYNGFSTNASEWAAVNCLTQGCTIPFGAIASGASWRVPDSTNNASDLAASTPGANSQVGTAIFTNAPGGIFRPAGNDTVALGNGIDLSGTFTDDLTLITRIVPWDIGALKADTDPPIVLTSPTAISPTSTAVTPQVTSDLAGGNLYAYALVGSGQTPDHATIKANAQSVDTPVIGVNTMADITSLIPGTVYTLAFSAETPASTPSTPVYVDFTTVSLFANVVLRNLNDNSLFANQTGVEFAVWDEASLAGIGVPDSQGTGSTDAGGVLAIPYGVSIGANGIVLARKPVAGVDNTNDLWAAGGVLAE